MEPKRVEEWLPVYAQIVGIVLGIALVMATIFGYAGLEFAGAYTFVTGLIFYRFVHNYRLAGRGEDNDKHSDRWSHLG